MFRSPLEIDVFPSELLSGAQRFHRSGVNEPRYLAFTNIHEMSNYASRC